MKVGFIILSYKNIDDTVECIRSLRALSDSNEHRVYLIDNSEAPEYAEGILQKVAVERFAAVPNLGYAHGNNVGMRMAYEDGCDLLVVMNNDTVVEPGFLAPLAEFLQKTPGVGLVSPLILTFQEHKIWSSGGYYRRALGNYAMTRDPIDAPTEAEFVSGCCCCFRRELLETVGYFEESYFMYDEDSDWCYRIAKAGLKNYILPESILYHKVSLSTGANSPFQLYYIFRNRLTFVYRNLKGLKKAYYLLANRALTRIRILLYLFRHDRARADALRFALKDAKHITGRYRY